VVNLAYGNNNRFFYVPCDRVLHVGVETTLP
jgi:hypothetical protein